jgi:hypothetical protein
MRSGKQWIKINLVTSEKLEINSLLEMKIVMKPWKRILAFLWDRNRWEKGDWLINFEVQMDEINSVYAWWIQVFFLKYDNGHLVKGWAECSSKVVKHLSSWWENVKDTDRIEEDLTETGCS